MTTPAAPTTEFNISNTQAPNFDPAQQAQLDQALTAFATKPAVTGVVSGSITGQPAAEVDYNNEEESPALEQSESEDTEETETEEITEEPELEGFDAEFSKRFGVKPTEAVEIINSLSAFRDEMSLMRNWGVSPGDYDARMTAVKEFYSTLPEDKQPEFNSVEGAKAIWEHLSKNTGVKNKSTTAKASGGKKTPAQTKTQPFLKKSEILKMNEQTYRSRLPEIQAAFREGRIVEDA